MCDTYGTACVPETYCPMSVFLQIGVVKYDIGPCWFWPSWADSEVFIIFNYDTNPSLVFCYKWLPALPLYFKFGRMLVEKCILEVEAQHRRRCVASIDCAEASSGQLSALASCAAPFT